MIEYEEMIGVMSYKEERIEELVNRCYQYE